MPALSAAELTAMRAVEDETMSSTCVIERATYAADGMGGRTETWAAVGTVVCDLYPINSRADRERYTGGQIQSIGGWFVTVPTSTDVLARDRLLIDSRTFEVTFVPNDADHLTALQVEAKTYNEERRNQNFVQPAASPAASFTGAYDAVPSITAAYGMRRLRTAYTGSILRIRRSSDNAEQDINAVANGDLDTAAVSSFIGGGSGYIVNWYDQSGNGYTAAQTTAASQPLYVASELAFNGTTHWLETGIDPDPTTWSAAIRFSDGVTTGTRGLFGFTTGGGGRFGLFTATGGNTLYMQDGTLSVGGTLSGGVVIISNQIAYLNGISQGAISTGAAATTITIPIGARRNISMISDFFGGNIQEVVFFNASLTAPQVAEISSIMAAL